MDTGKLLKDYIDARCNPLDTFPSIVTKGINTIAGDIPYKLKVTIALSELITFSSHLRKSIVLYDGTLVPTNAIVFALSGSGEGKDKAVNSIRKSLTTAYDKLEGSRKDFARNKAESLAKLAGDSATNWLKYYEEPKPLQAGLGTVEGLIQHFSDVSQGPLGAGSILTSEIGSELQTNGSMVEIIKAISVAYDLGNIPPKIIKSSDGQTRPIKGLPVNALFFGSQDALLFNSEIKAKFRLIFNTQLARRSIFSFTPETPPRLQISSIDELYAKKEEERERVLTAQEALEDLTADLVELTDKEPMKVSPGANKLFDVYLEYNVIVSANLSNKYPISKLSRRHKQWLALKMAGTYTILNNENVVSEESYAYAINTVEFLAQDLVAFEKELVKESYEQLSDYCASKAEDGVFKLSLHDLRKHGYISGSGSNKTKLQDLAILAGSYDNNANYLATNDSIEYKQTIKTEIVGISYIIF